MRISSWRGPARQAGGLPRRGGRGGLLARARASPAQQRRAGRRSLRRPLASIHQATHRRQIRCCWRPRLARAARQASRPRVAQSASSRAESASLSSWRDAPASLRRSLSACPVAGRCRERRCEREREKGPLARCSAAKGQRALLRAAAATRRCCRCCRCLRLAATSAACSHQLFSRRLLRLGVVA